MPHELLLEVCDLSVETLAAGPGGQPRRVLDGASFSLARKQLLGVIGESGAGKTVLARALAGGLPAGLRVCAGSVHYLGQDLAQLPAQQLARLRGNAIGYVGADPTRALDPTMSIGSQLLEKLRAVRPLLSRSEAQERVLEMLAAVRIPAPGRRAREYPFQFSGGMMQRVMLADALISEPALLIADSITQALDVTIAAQMLTILRELMQRFDTAIVFVSASLPLVASVADRVLVLQSGRVIESSTTAAVLHAPAQAYTQSLLAKIPAIWSLAAGAEGGHSGHSGHSGPCSGSALLEVQQVSKSYAVRNRSAFNRVHRVRAVRNVSFTVYQGESLGLVGESGCGKSSLTRLLTMLEKPDSGSVRFAGQDLAHLGRAALRTLRCQFQLLLQDPYSCLPPGRRIGSIIMEPLAIHRLAGGRAARQRALAVMDEVGLDPRLFDELPLSLSGGQRQRINIARALVLAPRLLILDETLSSLDQLEQARLLDLFAELQREHGLTYVYVSHDLALVRRACNRVAVMYLGELVELCANEPLYRDPGHPYSRALLSAIATLEPNPFRAADCLLDGEPPSPIDLPAGCGFANRCPQAQAQCRATAPPEVERGQGNRARCFLARAASS